MPYSSFQSASPVALVYPIGPIIAQGCPIALPKALGSPIALECPIDSFPPHSSGLPYSVPQVP